MRLWELSGPKCSVLLVRDQTGFSQPASLLQADQHRALGKWAGVYLGTFIPYKGLRNVGGSRLRLLEDGFLELQIKNETVWLGVLLFLDGPMVVVCACAYLKEAGAEPPNDQLEIARRVRGEYEAAKLTDSGLVIDSLDLGSKA